MSFVRLLDGVRVEGWTYHVVNVKCVSATLLGIVCQGGLLTEPLWIPLASISEDSEVTRPGESGTLIVSGKFAQKNRWTF